jgi:hypothetical protein
MSIYATLWSLKFPRDGDEYPGCEWIRVTAQAVPAHIGSPTPGNGYEQGDPFGAFLPPPVATDSGGEAEHHRAVVFVTENTKKGTTRSGQEYQQPLLTLTGMEYDAMTFYELHSRLCDALRGIRPRVSVVLLSPGGAMRILFEDGTVKEMTYPGSAEPPP